MAVSTAGTAGTAGTWKMALFVGKTTFKTWKMDIWV